MLFAFVSDYVNRRSPLFKFGHPVVDRGERHDDQEWSFIVLMLYEISKQRNSLDGFAKTHFVC